MVKDCSRGIQIPKRLHRASEEKLPKTATTDPLSPVSKTIDYFWSAFWITTVIDRQFERRPDTIRIQYQTIVRRREQVISMISFPRLALPGPVVVTQSQAFFKGDDQWVLF